MIKGLGSCPGTLFRAVTAALFMLTILCRGEGGWAETAVPVPERHEYTNVIMISLDILRPDHLGAYGYQRGTSPHIDRLAKQSVLFENSIAHSYLTPVAHMSVITGQ